VHVYYSCSVSGNKRRVCKPADGVAAGAARLGHADPAITLRVYAHVIRSAEAAPADIFAQAVRAA